MNRAVELVVSGVGGEFAKVDGTVDEEGEEESGD